MPLKNADVYLAASRIRRRLSVIYLRPVTHQWVEPDDDGARGYLLFMEGVKKPYLVSHRELVLGEEYTLRQACAHYANELSEAYF